MMMTKKLMTFALVVGLAACGGKKESGPGQDWSGKALDVTIEDTVYGVGFTLKAPKGMKLDGDIAPETVTRMWKADLDDYFSEPSIMVSYAAIPPKDLDGVVSDAMLDDNDVVAKKEATADGFVLVTHTKKKTIVRVETYKTKGEHTLSCRVSQSKEGGVPNPEKTMAWMEQICGSLTIN
jgi:hypothetical protein